MQKFPTRLLYPSTCLVPQLCKWKLKTVVNRYVTDTFMWNYQDNCVCQILQIILNKVKQINYFLFPLKPSENPYGFLKISGGIEVN